MMHWLTYNRIAWGPGRAHLNSCLQARVADSHGDRHSEWLRTASSRRETESWGDLRATGTELDALALAWGRWAFLLAGLLLGALAGDLLRAAGAEPDGYLEGCRVPPAGPGWWMLCGALTWGSVGAAIGGTLALAPVRRSCGIAFLALLAGASLVCLGWLLFAPSLIDMEVLVTRTPAG